jgi:hypothetical protein
VEEGTALLEEWEVVTARIDRLTPGTPDDTRGHDSARSDGRRL